jgi:hypothetical protein
MNQKELVDVEGGWAWVIPALKWAIAALGAAAAVATIVDACSSNNYGPYNHSDQPHLTADSIKINPDGTITMYGVTYN